MSSIEIGRGLAVNQTTQLNVSDVVFRADLYPRIEKSPATVQKYAEDIDVLPPIEVNQNKELIDGWHRWTAHQKKGVEKIAAIVTKTASDAELLELAIERNASHGLQLSQADKQKMARAIYHQTAPKDREAKKKHLAKILSVSERTVREWLSRIDKDAKEERDKQIVALWLACYTQEEIAERVGCSLDVVMKFTCQTAHLPSGREPSATHADLDPPLYNVWKFKSKSTDLEHPGNTEPQIVDNLLYLYTKPLSVVLDPFAGSGTTIDVCKKRSRRYFVSDRKPIIERQEQIREHDLTTGLPPLPKNLWSDVSLVYLDPPYWKQVEGQYSKDKADLANMPLEEFTETLSGVVNGFAKKLPAGAHIALIIQPTQWKAPNRQYTDHVADLLRAVKLPVEMRISCPYESQQCTAQMVDWAKAERQVLVLSREIIVWRT